MMVESERRQGEVVREMQARIARLERENEELKKNKGNSDVSNGPHGAGTSHVLNNSNNGASA